MIFPAGYQSRRGVIVGNRDLRRCRRRRRIGSIRRGVHWRRARKMGMGLGLTREELAPWFPCRGSSFLFRTRRRRRTSWPWRVASFLKDLGRDPSSSKNALWVFPWMFFGKFKEKIAFPKIFLFFIFLNYFFYEACWYLSYRWGHRIRKGKKIKKR